MNILMLCTKVPFPAKDGGALATMSMVSLLIQNGYKVTILAVNPPKHQVKVEPFSPMEGVKIIPVEVNTNLKLFPMFLNFIFGTKPYVVIRFLNRLYKEKLKKLIYNEKFDIVQIEGSQLGIYLNVLRQIPGLRVIIRAHNVEWKLWQELSENSESFMKRFYLRNMAHRYKRFEKHLFSNVVAVMPISEQDKKEILSFSYPGIIKYMPFGIDPDKYLSDNQDEGNTICFMGALDWIPNQQGLKWFLNMVWPSLKDKLPDISFHIAGRNAPDWLKSQLNTDRVFFHGEVTNAKAFIVNYPIMIVPLFSGSGVRIKILEGLALKRAIVSTSKGVEGLNVLHGKQLMITDNPTDFCNHIIKITNDIILRQKLSEEARNFVCSGYDNNSLKIGIAEFYNKVLLA